MTISIPHRSVLFMPISNQRAVNKARHLPVDTVVLDLEDSLASDAKEEAASLLHSALSLDFSHRSCMVRINAVDTRFWRDDITQILQAIDKGGHCDGIVVPKVDSTVQIQAVADALASHPALKVWIMIESPLAVVRAVELCGFGDLIEAVMVGTADLGRDLQLPDARFDSVPVAFQSSVPRQSLLPALSQIVLAARVAGIQVIDGVFMNFRDDEGLEREAWQGRSLGFNGKTLIHPAQLEITNRVFSPAAAEIAQAEEMIATWESASAAGQAVCSFKGALVEELHVKQARERVAFYRLLRQRDYAGT